MTSEGKQITDGIKGLRHLFADISLLIQTVDSEMPKHGWERTTKYDIVYSGLSQTAWQHQKWMPSEFFRFFESKRIPNCLSCISIILDNVDDPETVEEPLIAGSIFDYGSGQEIESWEYSYSRFHLYMPEREDDGSIIEVTGQKLADLSKNSELEKICTFAVPLVSITNADELTEKIVSPLAQYFEPLSSAEFKRSPP